MNKENTGYELGEDNITRLGFDIHNPVFLISGFSIIIFATLIPPKPRPNSSHGCDLLSLMHLPCCCWPCVSACRLV